MTERSTLQTAALAAGIVFLLVGIAGFIPGITEDAPGSFAGEDSEGSLLNAFQTSILHNLVHGLFGVLGIVMARTWEGANKFLLGGGIVYLALFVLGLLGVMDWLPADDTDDWLHLGLALGLLGLWGATRGRRADDAAYETRAANGGRT